MSEQHSLPMELHTADYFQKTKALHGKSKAWAPRTWWVLFVVVIAVLLTWGGPRL